MNKVYVAGSYTHPTEEGRLANISAALEAAKRAVDVGLFPIVPHSMFNHRNTTWIEAMDRCRDLIRGLDPERDIVVMLPNWRDSKGATEEFHLASFLMVPTIELERL